MKIKQILDELSADASILKKTAILTEQKDNELLKRVLYLAESKKVKYFLKQIPEYTPRETESDISLDQALDMLSVISTRVATGGTAIKHLHSILSAVHKDDAIVIERIIGKDLKVGVGTTLMNKVWPKFIEDTPYMGCIPFNEKKAKALFDKGQKAMCEIKADGRYVNVIITDGNVELESRQGEATLLGSAYILKELSTLEDCVLTGELVIPGIDRLTSNGLITSIIDITKKLNSDDVKEQEKAQKSIDNMLSRHGQVYSEILDKIQIIVWDVIDVLNYVSASNSVPRIDRFNRLKTILNDAKLSMINLVEYRIVSSYEEAMEYFVEALEREEEGVVLKSLTGVWKDGKPSYQIKMKVEFDLDLKIVGFNYGTKGTKNEHVISTISCESSCGKLIAKAQGMKEDVMAFVTENQDKLMGTILEVKCNGVSKNRNGGHSVFYPTASKFRDDKNEANSLEECLDIDAAAKGLKNAIK